MIRRGGPAIRILGTEVRVHLSWALVLVMLVAVIGTAQLPGRTMHWPPALSWLVAAAVAAGVFLSVIVHEAAHIAVARMAGGAPPMIILLPFGAAAPVDRGGDRPRAELAIAAAGPVASLALGLGGAVAVVAAATALPEAPGLGATAILDAVFLVSVLGGMVGIVNLVPVYPLDGARIVHAIAWAITGDPARATRVVAGVGRFTGYATIVAGILLVVDGSLADGVILAALGWVMRGSSTAIGRQRELEATLQGITVGDVMDRDLPEIAPYVTLDTFAEVIAGAGAVTAIPVMAADRLVGVVGLRDIRRIARARWETTRANEIMASAETLPVLGPDDDLRPAVERLQRSGADGIPVVAEGRLVGLLTRFGVGRALQERVAARRAAGRTPASAPPRSPSPEADPSASTAPDGLDAESTSPPPDSSSVEDPPTTGPDTESTSPPPSGDDR